MKRYEYKTVQLGYSIWTGRAKDDYLDIINEYGRQGWRFMCFSPAHAKPKGVKGIEIILERELES